MLHECLLVCSNLREDNQIKFIEYNENARRKS